MLIDSDPRNTDMTDCLFASDLQGQVDRYEKLFEAIGDIVPRAVFLGGDLLPHSYSGDDFWGDVIARACTF